MLDAESVMILREDYEAHDVAGLLKEYFRELPDPLMTEDAYAHFITASMLIFSALFNLHVLVNKNIVILCVHGGVL